MADRVRFEVADGRRLRAARFDLVRCFDCLHDMGDPTAAARALLVARARRHAG